MTSPASSPVWDEWGRTTRFLESTRIAFARERLLWESLELADGAAAQLAVPMEAGQYKVKLAQHLEAVADEATLLGLILIQSYALAEAAAAQLLGDRADGGVESWGGQLLSANHRDWTAVYGGKAGAVEVAVVRNAFAHGTRRIDRAGARRLLEAGAPKRAEGEAVTITYSELMDYRVRLRSLLRLGGVRPSEG